MAADRKRTFFIASFIKEGVTNVCLASVRSQNLPYFYLLRGTLRRVDQRRTAVHRDIQGQTG